MIEIDLDIAPCWDDAVNWSNLSRHAIDESIKLSDYSFLHDIDNVISISMSLSNNDRVHALNKEYRGKDKPTNILSFPMYESEALGGLKDHPIPEILLGDMILSYEICYVEAKEKGITINDHFQHLIVHGILHLLGYNHIEDDDADKMQSLEILALNNMGIENPYEKG